MTTAAERLSVALPPFLTSENLRCVQRGARLLGERRKRRRIVHREIGENLSIDFDAGELEPVDECVVVHVVLMRTRIDPHDPQLTEIALLILAIAVGVFPGALDGLLGRLPQLAAGAKGTARSLHDLFLPLQARNVRYGTRHGSLSLGLKQALHALDVTGGCHQARLTEAALPLRGLLGQDVALERLVPAHLPRTRDLEALRGSFVGLHLRHLNILNYFGARIMVIDFPSSRPALSIFPMSASAVATRSSTA